MDIIDNLKAFIFDRGYSQRDNKETKLYPVYSRKSLDIQGFSLFEILSVFAY